MEARLGLQPETSEGLSLPMVITEYKGGTGKVVVITWVKDNAQLSCNVAYAVWKSHDAVNQ